MSRSSRARAAVLFAGLSILVGPSLVASPAGAHPQPEAGAKVSVTAKGSSSSRSTAQAFLELINDERAAVGLDELTRDPALAKITRAWSTKMASAGRLAHNPDLADQVATAAPGWQRLAENVGTGSGVDELHAAFMASDGHRRNILGDFDRIGVGVKVTNGRVWVTVDFLQT